MGIADNFRASMELKKAEKENKAARLRAETLAIGVQTQALHDFYNSGYSHGGAASGKTWTEGYNSESLSPKSDIEENRKLLRERSRDLAMNAPMAAAAINSTRTNVVGKGLSPKPKVDAELLGLSPEGAKELNQRIKKEFSLWAKSKLCDTNDLNNFYEMQQIAFLDWLKNGEEFIQLKYDKATPNMPYELRLNLIEADRVCSPNSFGTDYTGEEIKSGANTIINGVEIDPNGKVVAYHICSSHPGEFGNDKKWTRVAKRGDKTGNLNIIHLFNAERAAQYRGVPFLAPVIHSVKQLTRYTEAEVMAAVVNSMFAVFITTEDGNEPEAFTGEMEDDYGAPQKDLDLQDRFKLGTGTINFLKNGEAVTPIQAEHPSGAYESFIQSMAMQIGSALEIAPEVLLKRFQNNFSASKGAINETWKSFMMRREWFVSDFCQEVYEIWFAEAVAKGRINAPGFFNDPLIRQAYTNATWTGPAQGYLNPVAEVNAAIARIQNGLSTHEDECAAINGSDFEDNIRTLKSENEQLADANSVFEEESDEDQYQRPDSIGR